MRTDRVVVVGAGVLGAAVTYHLARAGVEVVVVEADRPSAGASGATLSIDVTHLQRPQAYYRLNRAGAEEHRRLAAELAGPPWRHPAQLVQWADSSTAHHELSQRAAQLRSWGHTCRPAPAATLHKIAPAVAPTACTTADVIVHDNAAWYDAPHFVRTLLAGAARHGAEVHTHTPVTALLRAGTRVTGIVAGEQCWTADTVVNCAGHQAAEVAALAGVRLPVRGVPGLLVENARVPGARLDAILAAPGVNLRPTRGGRVLAQSRDIDAMLGVGAPGAGGAGPEAGPARELLQRAAAVAPEFWRAGPGAARIGVCPVPADNLPLVGALPQAPGLYHLVAHSGITLAPVLGRLAAQEICAGRPAAELAAYRPDRSMPEAVWTEQSYARDTNGA